MQGSWPPAVQPFSPDQAKAAKQFSLPAEVIEAINSLLAERVQQDGTATFNQDEAIDRITKIMNPEGRLELTEDLRRRVFANHWLDFEPIYEARGWKVYFDKAVAWGGDNYTSYWKFTPQKS